MKNLEHLLKVRKEPCFRRGFPCLECVDLIRASKFTRLVEFLILLLEYNNFA